MRQVTDKPHSLCQMQLASLPSPSHDSETRRTTKMGTGGTIGLTSQIRARIVKALKHEMEDVWKSWNWVDGDVSRSLPALVSLQSLLCESADAEFVFLASRSVG